MLPGVCNVIPRLSFHPHARGSARIDVHSLEKSKKNKGEREESLSPHFPPQSRQQWLSF